MVWFLIALLALVCCAALYAAGRTTAGASEVTAAAEAEAGENESDPHTRFYREQLKGLEREVALGRLHPDEVAAAKAELAREYLRQNREGRTAQTQATAGRVVLFAIPLAAILSFGVYLIIGQSHLPARPLAERAQEAAEAQQTLAEAVAQVEARLEQNPNDVRGWQVLAPVYLNQGRYTEAVNAYRRILDLAPPTADSETDLAEALILAAGGAADEEVIGLLESAAERDPEHIRSRFYLAGVFTRDGEFAAAVPIWTRLLDMAQGNEPWLPNAQAGLANAQAGMAGEQLTMPVESEATDAMILGMVESLAGRLYTEGGTGEEWSRLVQARLVLGTPEAAQEDFERGLAALEGAERDALLAYGESEGLTPQEAND